MNMGYSLLFVQTPSLLAFPTFFKWRQIGICWGQVLILEYVCADFLTPIKEFWLRSDERLERGLSLNYVLPEWNFENKFAVSNGTLVINIAAFEAFWFFLNSFNLTWRICTFSSSILGTWDLRLNYDAHPFIAEIRMTNEGSLLSSNFLLHLKHWKFEVRSYSNLLLRTEIIYNSIECIDK